MLRWLTAGESHGPRLTAVLEGLPAGVSVSMDEIIHDLKRRRSGYGRGARMSFEQDVVAITGGVRHGVTLGSPIAIDIENTEWPKWETVMSAEPVPAEVLEKQARNAPLTRPRPGHADLAGIQKYGFQEFRPVLERASARETAARVALGSIAKQFLEQVASVTILSHIVEIGGVRVPEDLPTPGQADIEAIEASPIRCFDEETSQRIVNHIDATKRAGDTLGGVIEVLAYGVPVGLGSYAHWDRRIDARLARAMMSIPAIKGVEVGDGFETARTLGSMAHDEIVPSTDGPTRVTNRSGGTEGGITTGAPIRLRVAMKPIPTVPKALATVDIETGEATTANHQRSDVCAVPAAGVVVEAMVALVLADALLEKTGGDSLSEATRNLRAAVHPLV